jgi:hypothetical protein
MTLPIFILLGSLLLITITIMWSLHDPASHQDVGAIHDDEENIG